VKAAAAALVLAGIGLAPARTAPPAARVVPVTPAEFRSKVVAPHRGRALVVNFWATWCVPCREEMPALVAAYRRMADRPVDVVLVSADALAERDAAVSDFLRKASIPFSCFIENARDPEDFINAVEPAWGGELPHTIVYDREGKSLVAVSDAQTEDGFLRLMRRGLGEGM